MSLLVKLFAVIAIVVMLVGSGGISGIGVVEAKLLNTTRHHLAGINMLTSSTAKAFSTAKPHFACTEHPQRPPPFGSSLQTPLPTNAWFQNLLLEKGDQPIVALPYSISVKSSPQCVTSHVPVNWDSSGGVRRERFCIAENVYGLIMSLPVKQSNRELVIAPHVPDMLLTANRVLKHHRVIAHDEVSVTLRYSDAMDENQAVLFPVVRGMPYVTGVYTGTLKPILSTIHAIMSINGQQGSNGQIAACKKLKLTLNNGQTYYVYSNVASEWQWSVNHIEAVSSGSDRINGEWVVRVAVQSPLVDATITEAVLDEFADVYAVGGSVFHTIKDGNVQLQFEWQTRSACGGDASHYLALALPHQQAILQNAQQSALQYDSVKGVLQGIVGKQWHMSLPAITTSFEAETHIAPQYIDALRTAVKNDSCMTVSCNIDPYTFGKEVAKLARVALIADQLQMSEERDRVLTTLQPLLEKWLQGGNEDALHYDTTYGGICSINGLKDRAADYGQGWYNDHHFHYGYIVYAAATLSRYNAQFKQQYREAMLVFVRDYANPSVADPFFPVYRHFDVFDGHSWAAGLFAFGDSRNQESSSESINSYYAVALLGEALNDNYLQQIGRTLLTLEVHGINRYWHMTSSDSVYPADYSMNKCVGIVWGSKIVDATWFASGPIYVHGIQLLPFTPVTQYYLPHDWVKEQYPVMLAGQSTSKPQATDEWLGFMHAELAVVDPVAAFEKMQQIKRFDNGNSRSNMIYWIATRPQQLRSRHS